MSQPNEKGMVGWYDRAFAIGLLLTLCLLSIVRNWVPTSEPSYEFWYPLALTAPVIVALVSSFAMQPPIRAVLGLCLKAIVAVGLVVAGAVITHPAQVMMLVAALLPCATLLWSWHAEEVISGLTTSKATREHQARIEARLDEIHASVPRRRMRPTAGHRRRTDK